MNVCRICKTEANHETFRAREMMFGLRDEFEYFECSACGCVQIERIPEKLARYYPPDYYSFGNPGALKSFLKRHWARYSYSGRDFVGRLLSMVIGENQGVTSVKRAGAPLTAVVLDVGCGRGDLLLDLFSIGFTDLTGVDPFNEGDLFPAKSVRIFKKDLAEMDRKFDLIMFHHSFEHMASPRDVFHQLCRLLHPNGTIIIRVPVVAWAWKQYRANWVQLDAPRHVLVPTVKGMDILAAQFGFQVTKVVYESTDFQFWGSEQYTQNIPLRDKRSLAFGSWKSFVPSAQIRKFRVRARELNEQKQGDAACFYLKPVPTHLA